MEHKDVSPLLTIVLTLKDRSPFTYRWMRWMQENKCPFKILIADGGEDAEVEKHLQDHSNYPNLNYEYIRYPYDQTISDFFRKHADIVSKVTTKYMIMQADNDDFFCMDGIRQSLQFLEENDDFFGCGGEVFYGILREHEKSHNPNDHLSGDNFEIFLENTPFIYDQALDSREKIARFFNQSHEPTSWYYIYRTNPVQKVLNDIVSYNFTNFEVHERFIYLSFWLNGKVKRLTVPYLIRQSNTSSNGDLLTRKFSKAYLLISDENYAPSIQRMINHFTSMISDDSAYVRDIIARYYERKVHAEHDCNKLNVQSYIKKLTIFRKLYHLIFSSFSNTQLINLNLPRNSELKKINAFMKNYQNEK